MLRSMTEVADGEVFAHVLSQQGVSEAKWALVVGIAGGPFVGVPLRVLQSFLSHHLGEQIQVTTAECHIDVQHGTMAPDNLSSLVIVFPLRQVEAVFMTHKSVTGLSSGEFLEQHSSARVDNGMFSTSSSSASSRTDHTLGGTFVVAIKDVRGISEADATALQVVVSQSTQTVLQLGLDGTW